MTESCRWCGHDHDEPLQFEHDLHGPRWSDGTLMLDEKYPPEARGEDRQHMRDAYDLWRDNIAIHPHTEVYG